MELTTFLPASVLTVIVVLATVNLLGNVTAAEYFLFRVAVAADVTAILVEAAEVIVTVATEVIGELFSMAQIVAVPVTPVGAWYVANQRSLTAS